MFTRLELDKFAFGEPLYLGLLVVPGVLLVLWCVQVWRRRTDVRGFRAERLLPMRERFTLCGELSFWPCLILATALCIVALARPQARIAVDSSGADIVILQDASASMHVRDVLPDRWQRAQMFLRAVADSLAWKDDRVALALFAHRAAPQLRLTKDPNSLFFFLDHLNERSPFSLEADTTWDTNIEEGVYWGLKLVEKDEELFGKSRNTKAFVVISDGQVWSGDVDAALELARARRIPVHVVGVGTSSGDLIPEPAPQDGSAPRPPVHASLDRGSLRRLAHAGGGEYFEIGQAPDRDLAFEVISRVRRDAAGSQVDMRVEDIYWRFLLAAAALLALGTLLLERGIELVWQGAGVVAALLALVTITS